MRFRETTPKGSEATMFNEQNEIRGDEMDDVRAELERIEGYEACPVAPESDEDVDGHYAQWSDEYPEDAMDGDHETALRDAGFGTDEDYGYYGGGDDFLDGSYEE